MGCFTPYFLVSLLAWLVVLGAIVAIVRLLIPNLLAPLGVSATVVAILNIILYAVLTIAAIWLVYDVLTCFIGPATYRVPPLYR